MIRSLPIANSRLIQGKSQRVWSRVGHSQRSCDASPFPWVCASTFHTYKRFVLTLTVPVWRSKFWAKLTLRVVIARAADDIFNSEIRAASVYDEMNQAYVSISQDRAIDVQGDARVYGYITVLRAVRTLNFMNAEPYELDFALPKKISMRIVIEVKGIARVAYNVTSKPPSEPFSIVLLQSI